MSSVKKTTNAKANTNRPNERLNMRRLPTSVTGLPEQLYTKYMVEITVSGPNTVTTKLRELDSLGQPGSYVSFEEAKKLCKAPGFVKAQTKDESRTELTEKTRALFFNARLDVKKVKDPKVFTKCIADYEENLIKSAEALTRVGESQEDVQAARVFKELHRRATAVANSYIADRIRGGDKKDKEICLEQGFPMSMKSKFLTGSFEVAPQGKFWTSLYGKEMHRFSNLSLEEIKGFSDEHLKIFYPDDVLKRIRELITDKALAVMNAHEEWALTPAKTKEKVLAYVLPVRLAVRKVEMLRRYETTKAQIPSKNVEQAMWEELDTLYNAILRELYYQPPRRIDAVREFWNRIAGENLMEPSLSSKSYRAQAIECLSNENNPEAAPEMPEPGDPLFVVVKNLQLSTAMLRSTLHDGAGAPVTVRDGFDQYHPVEIVGVAKTTKKRDRERQLASKRNNLSAKSKKLYNALKTRGVSQEICSEVKSYLENFLYIPMQEMAAHIVYVTCEISEKKAKDLLLDPGSDDSDDDDSSDEEDADGDEEQPLPAVMVAEEESNPAEEY